MIGDTHLGKGFGNGTPLHRRGDREAQQWEKFRAALATPADVIISMGDNFDHPFVSYGVATAVAEAWLSAATAAPDTRFIVMAGNHDRPRNLTMVGAWDAFREIVADRCNNLLLVEQACRIDDLLFLPWEWAVPVADQLTAIDTAGVVACFAHCDLFSFGGDESHIMPALALASAGIDHIFTGHYHLPGDYTVDGTAVHCTGSLEPYSHGEDPHGERYVTLPLEDVLADPAALLDKCVRVILKPGEELPIGLDCLALTAIRPPDETIPTLEAGAQNFEWEKLLEAELEPLDPEVRDFIRERLSG